MKLTRYAVVLLLVGCGLRHAEAVKPAGEAARQAEASKARVLEVGPGKAYAKPSDAARATRNGDIVEITAGVYQGDAAVWKSDNLIIRGVGGRAQIKAGGADAEDTGIRVIKGQNTTVANVELSGARVHDRNGAGIR